MLNGRYTEAVAIDNKTNIVIHGCGRDTVVVAPAGALAAIEIGNSDRIAIRDLAIEGPGRWESGPGRVDRDHPCETSR